MITQNEYMQGRATHRQFYAQFVTPEYITYVVGRIGAENLKQSTDEHLNDIGLGRWDMLQDPPKFRTRLKEAGTFWSLSSRVCVAKEAARQYLEELSHD